MVWVSSALCDKSVNTSTTYIAKCKLGNCESTGASLTTGNGNTSLTLKLQTNSPIAAGESLELSAEAYDANATYTWNVNNTTYTGKTLAVPNLAAGTYTVTCTATAGSCTTPSTTTVQVNQTADCAVYISATDGSTETYSFAPANNGVVKPLTLSVVDENENGTAFWGVNAGITYQWTGPNGFTSNIATPSVSKPGLYSLKMLSGTSQCAAKVSLSGEPCQTVKAMYCNPASAVKAPEETTRLNFLDVGDNVFAGDFIANILTAEPTGDGKFSGTAAVSVPYLKGIALETQFTNVDFNQCLSLKNGTDNKLVTVFDPTLGNVVDLGNVIDIYKNASSSIKDILHIFTGSCSETSQLEKELDNLEKAFVLDNTNTVEEKQEIRTALDNLKQAIVELKTCQSCTNSGNRISVEQQNLEGGDCNKKLINCQQKQAVFQAKALVNDALVKRKPTREIVISATPEMIATEFTSLVEATKAELTKTDLASCSDSYNKPKNIDGIRYFCHNFPIPSKQFKLIYLGQPFDEADGRKIDYFYAADKFDHHICITKELILGRFIHRFTIFDNTSQKWGSWQEFYPRLGITAGEAFGNMMDEAVYNMAIAMISGGTSFAKNALVDASADIIYSSVIQAMPLCIKNAKIDVDCFKQQVSENIKHNAIALVGTVAAVTITSKLWKGLREMAGLIDEAQITPTQLQESLPLSKTKAHSKLDNVEIPTTAIEEADDLVRVSGAGAGSLTNKLISRGLSSTMADDIVLRAMYIDDKIGGNKMQSLIEKLASASNFKNPEDLFINIDACMKKIQFNGKKISSADIDLTRANSLIEEFKEGKYWIDQECEVYISKKWAGNVDEVDVTIPTKRGLVECKNATGNDLRANLLEIIKKYTTEGKLSSVIKNKYPNHYGKISVSNASNEYYNLNKQQIINRFRQDLFPNINNSGVDKNTLVNVVKELHIENGQGRIIIKNTEW